MTGLIAKSTERMIEMIKRIGLIVGVVVLSLGLMLGQIGVGQMGQMGSMAASSSSEGPTLQAQIQLLKAINRVDLSAAQLQSLQDVLSDLQAADEALDQSRQELHRFLVNWQGDPAEFDAELKTHEQRLSDAHQAHHEAHLAAIDDVKGIFTIRQGEVLMQAFSPKKMDDKSMTGMMGSSPDAAQDDPTTQTEESQSMSSMGDRMKAKMASKKDDAASEKPTPKMGMKADQAAKGKAPMMGPKMENCPMMDGSKAKMASAQADAPRVTRIGATIIQKRDLWATVVNDKLAVMNN